MNSPTQASGAIRSFQLKFAKEQTEAIRRNLDNLVKNTIENAPMRTKDKDFCLNRETDPRLTDEEDKWERAMFKKWGPKSSGEFVSICKHMQNTHKDKCWGKIDLLGIGTDFLPVPIELKKRKPVESPLRMLIEVAAYGFAIRRVWPNLKDEWIRAVSGPGQSRSNFSETLDRVTLVGVAPVEYWCRCLGLLAGKGKFCPEAWPPFWKLVDALGKWFVIRFVALEGTWVGGDKTGSPNITGAQILDLQSLAPDPAAGASAHELARTGRDALLDERAILIV